MGGRYEAVIKVPDLLIHDERRERAARIGRKHGDNAML